MTATRKKKKIDWIKIKKDYLFKNIPLRELAEKHKVSFSAVKDHCVKEKWVEQREETQRKIDTETQRKTLDTEIARNVATNEEHISLYNEGLKVVKDILKVYQIQASEGKRRGNVNPFNLEKIFSCIEKAQKGQRLALNIDLEDTEEKEPEVFIIEGINMDKI